jgi:AcrR family transcriptional regulator
MERASTLMERRKQATVDDIVSVAIDLFSRDGFEATTVDAIAAAAGCSRRTFYRYFASKDEILFYDLGAAFEQLRDALDQALASGANVWVATCDVITQLIARFPDDERPVRRMELWLSQAALRGRYMQYVAAAEAVVADCLARHRGTKAAGDDLAQVIAACAIGAYRTTIATHPAGTNQKLTKHLGELLAMLDQGFAATTSEP